MLLKYYTKIQMLEPMLAIHTAAETGQYQLVTKTCMQPAALPIGITETSLDVL